MQGQAEEGLAEPPDTAVFFLQEHETPWSDSPAGRRKGMEPAAGPQLGTEEEAEGSSLACSPVCKGCVHCTGSLVLLGSP